MADAELGCARRYANRLLADLGAPLSLAADPEIHPARRWAQCGAMALTGYPDGPPQMCPVALASYADGIVAALGAWRPDSPVTQLDGAGLLGERAALAQLRRAGNASAAGGCRLLPARDGWLAVSLPRRADWELLPAWLQAGPIDDWAGLAAALVERATGECLGRARELGLPVAPLEHRREADPVRWCRQEQYGGRPPAASAVRPLVVDLSSLWAGPLCSHLLNLMGARVIKVESVTRPDGMRQEGTGFYDLLNAGKASVSLELPAPQAVRQLRRLLARADIVIEASRPRALRQLGIDAQELMNENPALTWVSITGYGRQEPQGQWVAFGDDGAVAGGLSQVLWDSSGRPMFAGDAIADPLAGLHAALAAWTSFAAGGGRLVSLALCDVIAHGIQFAALGDAAAAAARAAAWGAQLAVADIAAPRARVLTQRAPALGADNEEILAAVPG